MSQLDMESLLHYEHHLAACYEAEYLLELSMRREHISEGTASSWGDYDDSSEVRATTYHPYSSSPSFLLSNSGVEEMETENNLTPNFRTSRLKPNESDSLFFNSSLHHHSSNPSSEPSLSSLPLQPSQTLPPIAPLPATHVVCGKRGMVDETEPLRKKMCLQRPEL